MQFLLARLRLRNRRGRLLYRLVYLLAVRRILLQLIVKALDALLGDVNIESAQFIAQLFVLLCLADLTLEGRDLALHFAQDVRFAQQILLGLVDLAQRFLAVRLELGNARGLLENRATVLGFGRENRVNLTLRHDRITGCADARSHEQVLHVLQATRLLVDEILA